MHLQRKGLALLGYLALEGPTSRAMLADVLWGHEGSANNLRVELHRLRHALRAVADDAFATGMDPISLPEAIEISAADDPEQLMLGFEDLSPVFGDWLRTRRTQARRNTKPVLVRRELVERLARTAQPPHLLLLHGSPGDGRETLARSLARAMGLPFVAGKNGSLSGVRFVDQDQPYDRNLVERILADRESVWVVARSRYVPDTRLALEVRAAYPPARLKHVRLEPLSWPEARNDLLEALPFEDAAQYYVFSGGHLGLLSELLANGHARSENGNLTLPQRIRASFLLESSLLCPGAARALQHLSVHPGRLPETLLEVFDAEPQLDELEAHGWLHYNGGYSFATEVARRVLYEALPPGQRVRSHQRAAEALRKADQPVAAAFHLGQSGARVEWGRALARCPSWAKYALSPSRHPKRAEGSSRITRKTVALGDRLPLLATEPSAAPDTASGKIIWWRIPPNDNPLTAEYELPETRAVMRVRLQAYVENPGRVGLHCDAVPLRATIYGSPIQTMVWTDVSTPTQDEDGTMLLPLHDPGETLFLVEHGTCRFETRAHTGVLELEIELFEGLDPAYGRHPETIVSAIDLT